MKITPLSTLLFILLSTATAFAQTQSAENITLDGKVLEKQTGLPLAYVSVGVLNKPLGTVSDTLGHFTFTITGENLADTLQLSMVGYDFFRIAVKDFISNTDKNIRLTVNTIQLADVIVTPSGMRKNEEIIGRQKSGKLIQVSIHNKKGVEETIGSEMGMRYKTDKPNAILKDFNFYLSANNFDDIKFRVNIYSLKNGMPDTLKYNKQIFASVANFKTGWIKVDLESFNIHVNDEFLVSLQWIESRMEKKENPVTIIPVGMSPFSKNCYVRIASQDKWTKKGMNLSNFITVAY